MPYLVMERSFENPLTGEDLEAMMERVRPCLERYGVRWRRSYLSNSRQRMICVFEAPDAESVRIAYRMAALSFGGVWPAQVLAPDGEPVPTRAT